MNTLSFPHLTITGMPSGLSAHPVVVAVELLLFGYFLFVNILDFVLISFSMRDLPKFVKLQGADSLIAPTAQFSIPVSIILPAFNEAERIVDVAASLLKMDYPQHELIVVNDGSTDATLDRLTREYELIPIPEASYVHLKTKPVRRFFRSAKYANLRVIDKERGGKGDALNAGINEARYPLILATDGDSLYAPETLRRMFQPFANDPRTVGCGAALRILNGAKMADGKIVKSGLPRNLLVRFQMLEYLRAALNSRFGWTPLNGVMCISGACAMWKKDVIVATGGYAADTVWEDAEMTVRVHHYMRTTRQPYKIAFVPSGLCWTTVPDSFKALGAQRISWQRHITETITRHRNLLFSGHSGMIGWLAFPAYVLLELLAPLWLLVGLAFVLVAGFLGILSVQAQLALLVLVFALTLIKMALAFVLDEMSYRTHRLREIWTLFVAALLEQIGYRQLVAWWGIVGMFEFYAFRPMNGRTQGIAGPTDPTYHPKRAPAK